MVWSMHCNLGCKLFKEWLRFLKGVFNLPSVKTRVKRLLNELVIYIKCQYENLEWSCLYFMLPNI